LQLAGWKDTCDTLHLWTQVVGKVKLALVPPQNHWWQVGLEVTPRGLTTGVMPCGARALEIRFDLLDHDLIATTSDGRVKAMPLLPRSVAAFHAELMGVLASLGVEAHVWRMPVEIPDPIPFDEDEVHRAYDEDAANRFLRVLLQTELALRVFASGFQGKQSPINLWWGTFDLDAGRYSGRRAPERQGADRITREAYSHEVMEFGFWPGGGIFDDAAFFAFCAPPPDGFGEGASLPAAARYLPQASEYVLPYADVRASATPLADVLAFFQGVYDHGATLAGWDRAALDRPGMAAPRWPGGEARPPEHPTAPA
jgi:hypothetical protein